MLPLNQRVIQFVGLSKMVAISHSKTDTFTILLLLVLGRFLAEFMKLGLRVELNGEY